MFVFLFENKPEYCPLVRSRCRGSNHAQATGIDLRRQGGWASKVATRMTVPPMMLPGAGRLGCSPPAGHSSILNPAVLTTAIMNGCPVSVQMLCSALTMVPDRHARACAWPGSPHSSHGDLLAYRT
jgi:hypothetical protein